MNAFRLLFVFFLLGNTVFSQIHIPKGKLSKITYMVSYNGNTDENQNPIWVFADTNTALISSRDQFSGKLDYPHEMTIIQTNDKKYIQLAFLKENESVGMTNDSSIAEQEFEFLDETKVILGYNCKKAKTIINSNTIEIWYTDELGVKGGPSVLGSNLGLVLETVRNGNFEIKAVSIDKEKSGLPDFLKNMKPKFHKEIDYRDKVWNSRFTTLNIFDKQQIHWSEEFEPREGVMRFANGTIAVKKVKFPKIEPGDLIFLDLVEQSLGDAYDRTGSVFLIPTDKKQSFVDGLENGAGTLPIYENGNGKEYQGVVATEEYSPIVELMRFFTPFGVSHFNDRVKLKGKIWHTSVPYRSEISRYAELMSEKEVYIGVFIGNYDKGGHQVSANITIHKNAENDKELKKVLPLFNTLNVMEMAGQEYGTMFNSKKGLTVDFKLEKPMKNAQLFYITTGHGGWGNGDEFVQKKNTVILNGKTVFDMIPWKEDCGSYRLFNPVSGNFSNGLSSSDYSRSNWCPGTVTNPFIIDLGDLDAGKHQIQVIIPQGEPEGNSFSSWNVSGAIVGEE